MYILQNYIFKADSQTGIGLCIHFVYYNSNWNVCLNFDVRCQGLWRRPT